VTVLIPISIGVSILRYRLWDIDTLINKALVYGALTITLALLYFGLTLGLQTMLERFFHQASAITLVLSTLAIAALFQPLRARLQVFIDRRFYRKKYDAEQVLISFGSTLREQINLEQLSERLVAAAQETMQPTSVSLWLAKSNDSDRRHTQMATPDEHI
jgi:hypothetical protein